MGGIKIIPLGGFKLHKSLSGIRVKRDVVINMIHALYIYALLYIREYLYFIANGARGLQSRVARECVVYKHQSP